MRTLLQGIYSTATAVLLSSAPGLADEPSQTTPALAPGVPIERQMAAGSANRFRLELAVGRRWLVSVEQLGINVVMDFKTPEGSSLITVDTPQGREGTESLLLMPELTGSYILELRSEEQGAPGGRYQIRLDELPASSSSDQTRLRAWAAATEAARRYASQDSGSTEEALAELDEALDAWRSLGERRQEAQTLFFIGRVFDLLEDRRQALDAYGQALALWRQLDDRSRIAATLERLGLAHKFLGKNPQAIPYLEEALAVRQELGQPAREAETRNSLCLVLHKLGRFRTAGQCYRQTLDLARELEDMKLEATLLNNLGGIHQNLGEPADALESFQQALELRRAIGAEADQAITLNNLGVFHRRLGEIEEALLAYSQALPIFERLENDYWQARTLNNIGFAYLTLGELERARAFLLRALPLRRTVADRSGESATLRNLGMTFDRLGQPGKAKAYFLKALEKDVARDNRRGTTTTRKLLGKFQLAQGEPAAARGTLELALESLRQMGKRKEEAEVLELLSRVHLDLGEPEKSMSLATKALALHRAVRDPVGELTALTTLSRISRRQGRYAPVRESLEQALTILETLHRRIADPSQKAAFFASQREVYELHVDALMKLHRQHPSRGHQAVALEASERARSRSLLGLLEQAGVGPGPEVGSEWVERLAQAERNFAAKTRRHLQVLSHEHSGEQALAAEQEVYSAQNELENVRAEIRRQSPRYASLDRQPTLDSAEIRGLLDEETVLLEYLLGEERSFLWWVTPSSIEAYELPPRATIETLASQIHQQISAIHRRDGATRESLEKLGSMLLGPVTDRLQGQRLVIVADGALHLVPFGALPLPGMHQPVLTRHEVAYLPSASVLALQRLELTQARRTPPRKALAIFADPIFDRPDPRIPKATVAKSLPRTPSGLDSRSATPGSENTLRGAIGQGLGRLDRLPHTRREALAIADLLPTDERFLALDSDARRSRVMAGELSPYRIVHFATHGFVHPRRPELSGLVLSTLDTGGVDLDGFLGLHDVAGLELSAELVVLSGCRTALGKQVRGEGLVGLTRGFMHAGVPRVVASFWQVRDEATAELMAQFYRLMLAEGLSPATALRSAQLELRQKRRYRDPFYWAAFSLQGDWR